MSDTGVGLRVSGQGQGLEVTCQRHFEVVLGGVVVQLDLLSDLLSAEMSP